jgi:hypothetical protein
VLVDEFVDALCGRTGGATPGGSRSRADGDDGYSADAEADEGDGISPGAAPHLVSRVPTAGSKRRAPSASSAAELSGAGLRERDVDCIAERLSRIQASPPKRRKAGASVHAQPRAIFGVYAPAMVEAPADGGGGGVPLGEAAPGAPLCWPSSHFSVVARDDPAMQT